MANKKKFLSKEQIVAAQGKTLSNMAAARYFMFHTSIIRNMLKCMKYLKAIKTKQVKVYLNI